MKTIFRCRSCSDIHIGVNAPNICPTCQQKNTYEKSTKDAAFALLLNLGVKKLWRCIVCNDLQIGKAGPAICPTCQTPDAYVEINKKEFELLLPIIVNL